MPDDASVVRRHDLALVIAAFGNLLHAAGVPVTPERSARFAQAVLLVEVDGLDGGRVFSTRESGGRHPGGIGSGLSRLRAIPASGP